HGRAQAEGGDPRRDRARPVLPRGARTGRCAAHRRPDRPERGFLTVPSAPPKGESAPADGALPAFVREGAEARAFGIYVHVPYCRVRCGYCDFNTYTASELGGGASQAGYAAEAAAELSFAAGVMRRAELPERPVSTVFFGGGTPTLLPASDLSMILGRIRDEWSLAPGAEVTTEANPDSVDERYLNELAEAGFT